MASRAIVRKMQKIVRDLLKRDEIRTMLDATIEINEPILAILKNPEKVDEYGEDVMQFKQDIDACIKYLSRMRGKKSDSIVLATHFDKILQEFFPDVFLNATTEPERKSYGKDTSANKEKPVEDSTSSSTRKRPRGAIEPDEAVHVNEPLVVSDRRRSSSGKAEALPPQSSSTGSTLTAIQKSEFRTAVNNLMKNAQCKPFLYPVDKSVFPDYYKFIDSPMDLSTLKSKIASYETVQELIHDFRLIWSNCKAFNAEGSEIYTTADELSAIAESHIETIFGPEFVRRKPGRKKSSATAAPIAAIEAVPPPPPEVVEAPVEKKSRRSVAPAPVVAAETAEAKPVPSAPAPVAATTMSTMSKQQLRQLIKGLESCEYCYPFEAPVDVNYAPGYLDIIQEPMDISTVKKKLRSGAYDGDTMDFVKDIRLIGKNCILYNVPGSDISICAENFSGVFEDLLQKELGNEYVPPMKSKAEEKADGKQTSATRQPIKSKKESASEQRADKVLEEEKADSKLRLKVPEIKKVKSDTSLQQIAIESTAPVPATLSAAAVAIVNPAQSIVESKVGSEKKKGRKVLVKEGAAEIPAPPKSADIKKDGTPARPRGRPKASANAGTASSSTSNAKPGNVSGVSSAAKSISDASKGVVSAAVPPAVAADPKPPNSVAQIDQLIANLQTQPSGKMPLIREKAITLARQRLEKLKLPTVIFPSLYTIESFGEVVPWATALTSEIIYPSDYSCSRKLRIYQVNSPTAPQVDLPSSPFVEVELCSRVRIPTSFDHGSKSTQWPVFPVTLANGTLVAESSSPKIAWLGIFGKELNIIHSVGGRMRRCRSVFNRLAASPGAVHFLEENSFQQSLEASSTGGNNIFKPLIWLRMIHEQLVQGTYESEFEFAWDMRYLFKQALQYSQVAAASEVAAAANNLSVIFESLFAHWVLNVQDISVTQLATGQWDDWMYLRYFDIDATQRSEDHLRSKCRCCGDLKGVAAASETVQDEWVCPRCTIALFWSKNNMAGDPFAAVANSVFSLTEGQFNCEEMNGTCYFPVISSDSSRPADSDSMRGWMQAKKRHRAELVPVFLSPFGNIVHGYDGIPEQIQKEKAAHDSVRQARVFRSSSSSFGSAPYPHALSFKRLLSSLEGAVEYESNANDKLISLGSVANYRLPESDRLAFFSCRDEQNVIATVRQGRQDGALMPQLLQDRVELTPDRVPDGGFFGLELPEVIAFIEGLKGLTDVYPEYTFKYIDAAVAEVLHDLKNEKKKYTNIAKGEENLKQLLKYERWYWERLRLNSKQFAPTQPVITQPPALAGKHQIGFIQLFPYFLPPPEGEVLLCLWDFIESCKAHIGSTFFSLTELVASVKPVTSPLTTVGQVVFDEINCILTGFLFSEMQQRAGISDDQEWQDLIFSHPINIMTWPYEALLAIRVLSLPGTPLELKAILSAPSHLSSELWFKLDILCLLFNHPLIDHFMLLNDSSKSLSDEGYSLLDAKSELQQIREGLCALFAATNTTKSAGSSSISSSSSSSNETVPEFAAKVISIFCKLLSSPTIDPVYAIYARIIHRWLTDIFHNKKITIDSSLASLPAHTERELSVKQSAENNMMKMKFTRYWGSYALSNMDIPSDQLLTPNCFKYFHNESAEDLREYEGKKKALESIEKVLHVLSNVEPENMDSSSRVAVYSVLLDYCMTVKIFAVTLRARQEKSAAKLSELKEYGGYLPNNVVPVLEPATVVNKATRCIYTRIKAKNCPTSLKFVVVPKEYHAQPPILNSQRLPTTPNNSSVSDRNQPLNYLKSSAADPDDNDGDGGGEADGRQKQVVALEKALLRIILMREVARVEQQKYESKLPEMLQVLADKRPLPAVADYEAEKPLSLRSMPLGYDRQGNSYWLLGAQELMTIFPVLTMDTSVAHTKPIEPCLLIREANGWWGYHNGHDLRSLVSILSVDIPCEKFLRECLLERLVFTRRVLLHGTLKLKLVQQEYLDRRARSEKGLSAVAIQSNISELKKAALVETVWARCVEIRMLVYYSLIFKQEDDLLQDRMAAVRGDKDIITRKLDALRDKLQGDSFDHHPTKGWLRFDKLTRIRELATTTTATKILADSSVFPLLQSVLAKSKYLKRVVPSAAQPMEIEGSSENVEDDGKAAMEEDVVEDTNLNSSSLLSSSDSIPQAEQLLEKLYSKHSHTKCIEQLHLVTGEVLRVYPSGKDAAQFMNVTQSGISLCTSGLRPDCYGFRWRIYEGPPIDFDAIKDRQTPLAELKKMQIMRGKPVAFNREEEAARAAQILLSKQGSKQFDIDIGALKVESDRKSNTVSTRSQIEAASKEKPAETKAVVQQPPAPVKPDLVTSNLVVLPRLLRLKGELLNILFMLPAKRLNWRAPTGLSAAEMESEQASITAAGEKASKSVYDGAEKAIAARASNAASTEGSDEDVLKVLLNDEDSMAIIDGVDVDLSPSNVEVLAEKAAEKARQKLSRQLSMQRFIRDVQQAMKPQQLLQLASQLEDAIPAEYLFYYNKADVPMTDSISSSNISDAVVSVAEVASKIFTIDRSICYDELRGEESPDSAASSCPYRLRTQFSPRCLVNSRCKKFLCHSSRCVHLNDTQNSSRVPDGHDVFITQSMSTSMTSSQAPGQGAVRSAGSAASYSTAQQLQQHQQQHQQQQMYQYQQQQQQYQRNDLSLREVIKRMKIDKREIDIEITMPYIPGNFEITTSEWV